MTEILKVLSTEVITAETQVVEVIGVGPMPGKPGASAFELAQANGFEGDQAAWLASLHGAPGVISVTAPLELDEDHLSIDLTEYATVEDLAAKADATDLSGYASTSDLAAKANTADLLDWFYPVGTIYETTAIATIDAMHDHFGGTWEVYGQGRVLVGAGSNGENSYTEGSTGGADSVTLTENQMPAHTHRLRVRSDDGYLPNGATPRAVNNQRGGDGSNGQGAWSDRDGGAPASYVSSTFLEPTGGGQSHENRQAFVVVHRYRRTA